MCLGGQSSGRLSAIACSSENQGPIRVLCETLCHSDEVSAPGMLVFTPFAALGPFTCPLVGLSQLIFPEGREIQRSPKLTSACKPTIRLPECHLDTTRVASIPLLASNYF